MGRNHARVLSETKGVQLVGVCDPFDSARNSFRPLPGTNVYSDHREMYIKEKPDAVVLVTPTTMHCEQTIEALEAGMHVMVEKPISSTLEEADRMIAVANKTKKKLMVGHLERFNPAVTEVRRRIQTDELGKIFQISAKRLSPFPGRISDVGVILDLAVHDIDAMHAITGSTVTRAYAELQSRSHKTAEDVLTGLIRFKNDVVGSLEISWQSPQKVRQLSVFGEGGAMIVDYLTQDLTFQKNGTSDNGWEELSSFTGQREGEVIKFVVQKKEPLKVEHDAFIDAILNDKPMPVTGEEGRSALEVALALIDSGHQNLPIFLNSCK